jgi:predicted GH43/DUF377 family glycosyl hydrolase
MVPTPEKITKSIYKIYYSGRDMENRSHIGFAILDLSEPIRVLEYANEPIVSPGDLGCFDDNGVTPSCVIDINGAKYLYYIGWNPGSTVRVHLFGGLAISRDGGKTFNRWSRAPVVERSRTDPFLNTAPWVVPYKDQYRMYYVSGTGWQNQDLPRYNIKIGFSDDGKEWQREGHVCIDFADASENALARPYVIFEEGVWKMWFAHKGEAYRLGYAESEDGLVWERNDECVGLTVSKGGFDSEMVEYAAVLKHNGRRYMFYNGNNYGHDGIGLAVEA